MRSSSLAILIAARVSRRSTAMGWRSARSFSAGLRSAAEADRCGRSLAITRFRSGRVAPRDGFDGVGELGFGQPAHLRHAARTALPAVR